MFVAFRVTHALLVNKRYVVCGLPVQFVGIASPTVQCSNIGLHEKSGCVQMSCNPATRRTHTRVVQTDDLWLEHPLARKLECL